MRKIPAGSGAVLIDAAVVIGAKERAGESVENIILFFVHFQIGLNKITRFDFQGPGKPGNVSLSEKRTRSMAAVGAFETVYFQKNLIMKLLHQCIHKAAFHFFQFLKIFFIFPILVFRLFQEFFIFSDHERLFFINFIRIKQWLTLSDKLSILPDSVITAFMTCVTGSASDLIHFIDH